MAAPNQGNNVPRGVNPPVGGGNQQQGGQPQGGQAPAGQIQAPAGQVQAPVGQAQAPAGQVQALAGQAQAPVGQAQAPVGQAQPHVNQPQAPVGQAQPPVGQPQPHVGQPQAPVGQVQAPIGQAQAPANQAHAGQMQPPVGQVQAHAIAQGQAPAQAQAQAHAQGAHPQFLHAPPFIPVQQNAPFGQLPYNPAQLDPNMIAHMDSLDRSAEITSRLLERLTIECAHSVRKDELQDVMRGLENVRVNNRRGPNVTLPRFSGDATSSFEEFWRDLEEKFNFLQWDHDHPNRVQVLPTLLDGLAKIKYREMPQRTRDNFSSVMRELQRLFGLESKNAIHVYQQLERPQRASELVCDYSRDILQRMQNSSITDERYMLATYLKNLRSNIRAKVLLMSPQTLAQAQQCAETVEATLALDDTEARLQATVSELQRQNDITQSTLNSLNQSKSVSFAQDRHRSHSRNRSSSRDRYDHGRYRQERQRVEHRGNDYQYPYRSSRDGYNSHNRSPGDGYNAHNGRMYRDSYDRSYDRYYGSHDRDYASRGRDRSRDASRGRDRSHDGYRVRDRSHDGYRVRDRSHDGYRGRNGGTGRSHDRSRDRSDVNRYDRSQNFSGRARSRSHDRYDRSFDRNASYNRSPTPYRRQQACMCEGACAGNCDNYPARSSRDVPPATDPYCNLCKENHPFGQHTSVQCFNCSKYGHVAQNCPNHLN